MRWPSPTLRSAPLRGLREPAAGVGLAVAAAVLALATAGTPLYQVAVGHAALAGAVEGFHSESLGLTVGAYSTLEASRFDAADRLMRSEGAAAGLPAPPFATVLAEADTVPEGFDPFAPPDGGDAGGEAGGWEAGAGAAEPPPTRPVRFFARDRVTEHLPEPRPCPAGGDGVWVSTRLASSLDLEPCGTLRVVGDSRVVAVGVAGVYRDLLDVLDTPLWDAPDPLPADSATARYWSRLGEMVVRLGPDGTPIPQPPLVVAEPRDLAALGVARAAGIRAHQRWTFPFPLERAWHLEVRETAERYEHLAVEARRVDRPLGEAMIEIAGHPMGLSATTLLPEVAERADRLVAAVRASMQPLGTAGQVAAALVVAAAGVFEARRRRTERMVLAAQGIGPAGTGARAALESLLPVAAGSAAGTAAAIVLVRAAAPGEPPDAALVLELLPGVALWAAGAVVLLAVTAASAAPSRQRPGALPAPGWLRRHPWEAVPLLLAGAAYWTMRTRGEVLAADQEGAAAGLDLSYVLFPLLLLAACGGLAARVLPRVSQALRLTASAAPASLYLAARRLAVAPAGASLLVAGTAVGVGVLLYAAAVGASTERGAATAGEMLHGAPTVVELGGRDELEELGRGATVVSRMPATLHPHGDEVDLLTIHEATFGEVAFWRERFADRPLTELLAALGGGGGEAVPLVLVGADPGERPSLETSRYRVPVRVVARPSAFPGMSGRRPLAVAATGTLAEVVNASGQSSIDESLMLSRSRWLWTVDEPERALALLEDQPVQAGATSTVARFRDERPRVASATWALGYLQGVGGAAGLLGLVALLLYLHGQQRRRAASYALLSRMGLSRRQHRRAVTFEIGALVATALVAGGVAGTAAAWLVVTSVETLPRAGPPPEFVAPWAITGVLVPVTAVLSLAAAWASHRAAERAPAGELLRAAD